MLTGTQGHVDYDIQRAAGQLAGTCHINWDNPYLGSNDYDEQRPRPSGSGVGGGGDNAVVRLTLSSSSSAHDGIPDQWKMNGVTSDPGDGAP